MQKKVLALAIAAAVSAPAFADNANINVNATLYGKLFIDVEHVSSDNVGTDAAGGKVSSTQNRAVSNTSRLGFKGKEDLGEGLTAIYQLEVQVDGDGSGNNGLGSGTRNSHAGLEGGFGTAFLGIWDTPFKTAHDQLELFDNTTFASTTDLLGRVNGGTLNMNTRLKDSVQYWSPNMGGFQVKAAYGVDNAKTTTTATPAVTGTNQTVTSLSAAFDNEMFYAALAYQAHKDNANNYVAAGNKTTGTRLVGAFKINSTSQVGVTFEKLQVDVVAIGVAPAVSMARNAFELTGKTAFGAHNIGAAYVKAGDLSNAAAVAGGGLAPVPGATQVSLRYGYKISKRTELFAMYSSVKNKIDAANNLSGNYGFSASSNVTNSKPGATQTGLGAGLIIDF